MESNEFVEFRGYADDGRTCVVVPESHLILTVEAATTFILRRAKRTAHAMNRKFDDKNCRIVVITNPNK